MRPLMPSVDTPDKLFHDGDPTQGIEGTIVEAEFMNNHQAATQSVQQELINVLAAAAMQPDPAKQDQLVTAIRAIINAPEKGWVQTVNGLSPDANGAVSIKIDNISDAGTAAKATVVTSPTDTTAGRVLAVGYGGWGIKNGTAPYLASIFDIACSGMYAALGKGATTPTEGMPDDSGNTRYGVLAANIYTDQYWVTLISNREYYVGNVNAANRSVTWYRFYNTACKPTAADTNAVSKTGDTMTDKLTMNVDGEAIRLKPKTAGYASYIICSDSANANHWYVGAGSATNANVTLLNYKGANNSITLNSDGTVNLNPTQGKSAIVNGPLQVGTVGSAILNIGDGDSGLRSSVDGAVDLWANNQKRGYWNTTTFSFVGQIIPSDYANFDARYGGGKTTTGTNNAYYTHANGVVFMQAVRSIAVGNNATVTVTLPTSFPNGILGVGASFYGTGGQDQDSYYLCTPVGKNQVTINTHNCNGTFSLIVSGY
ncbi:hypothetical protein EXW94_23850 [Enterobacter sp. JMULE2]|uniref:hypothetical protein n=1 Tax=Enterobacter sp. JMULE2 TaxID=2518340 RepID=UPI0015760349|nr:hypothetical protein [Enterobacter sp. JMULE2]NTZ40651.1 hypothetical protein [Enterobacter sp. JMULE2]